MSTELSPPMTGRTRRASRLIRVAFGIVALASIAWFLPTLSWAGRITASRIANPDNCQELREAMKYDPYETRDKTLIDREEAIENYWKYVNKYPKGKHPYPINRQKVIARIGFLQMDEESEKLKEGIRPDFRKGVETLGKAIEANPEHICYLTLIARTHRTRAGSLDASMRKEMEVYKWLANITDEQLEKSVVAEFVESGVSSAILQAAYIPPAISGQAREEARAHLQGFSEGDLARRIQERIRVLRTQIDALKESAAGNLIRCAESQKDADTWLLLIADELDGYPPAAIAREKLKDRLLQEAEEGP